MAKLEEYVHGTLWAGSGDKRNFLHSANMHSVALEKGLWDGNGLLDFTATYSDGEYAHKYYSGRRVWGVYKALAPQITMPTEYDEYRKSVPYPVSAPPKAKVTPAMPPKPAKTGASMPVVPKEAGESGAKRPSSMRFSPSATSTIVLVSEPSMSVANI